MRNLAQFRFRYADTFDLTSATWKHFQVALGPVLGISRVGAQVLIDTYPGVQISPPATPEDCGLMVVAAMLRGDRSTIRQRVLLRWHSRIADAPDGVCPVTNARYFHEAMTRLLLVPEIAAQLDHVELTREFSAALIAWKDGSQSQFESLDPRDRARRETVMSAGRMLCVSMLGGSVFHDMARWLGEDPAVVARRTERLAVK
jgi:hypothetical protein